MLPESFNEGFLQAAVGKLYSRRPLTATTGRSGLSLNFPQFGRSSRISPGLDSPIKPTEFRVVHIYRDGPRKEGRPARHFNGDMPDHRSKARVKAAVLAYPSTDAMSLIGICVPSKNSRDTSYLTSSRIARKLVPLTASCRLTVRSAMPKREAIAGSE